MKSYTIPKYGITVKTFTAGEGRAGEIESDLKKHLCSSPLDEEGTAVADALESFILALACQGYDIADPKFVAALDVSLEAIANNS